MSFEVFASDGLTEILEKIKRTNISLFKRVQKKIKQIGACDEISINHYKNLRGNLSGYKRVHIGSFVLFFKLEENTIIFDKFRHHDKAY